MSAAWVIYGLIVGTLLMATAATVDRTCALISRPRRWVWASALALMIALIAVAPLRVTAGPVASAVVEPGANGPMTELRRIIAIPSQAAASLALRYLPSAINGYLLAAWATLSAVLVLMFAIVYVRSRLLLRAEPLADLQGIRVRLTAAAGPVVVGLLRPEIVVPRWLLLRPAEEQRLVLAHEREHAAAHDSLLLALGCVAAAFVPWHPAVWWMLARLRLAVEMDCDARVLRGGVTRRSYGMLLIELAGKPSGLRFGVPALADGSSHLQQRLLAMIPTVRRFAFLRAFALCTIALIALLAACDSTLPTTGGPSGEQMEEGEPMFEERESGVRLPVEAATLYAWTPSGRGLVITTTPPATITVDFRPR
jgi:beta-lactamase regulating signal transducer with metallopeptidase domain